MKRGVGVGFLDFVSPSTRAEGPHLDMGVHRTCRRANEIDLTATHGLSDALF